MGIFFHFIVFILGLVVGSFLNCLIYRLETNQSFFKGRSFCPECRHQLNWQDLIPVLSFLILRGRCRYCQRKISWQYPLVEISTALMFLLIYNFPARLASQGEAGGQILYACFLFLISCFLIVIFVYDFKHYLIPDKIIYPAILTIVIWHFVSGIFFNFYPKYEILNTINSAFGAAGFFLLIVLISKGRWMGVGDIKLAFFMGLFLGFPKILIALFSAFFIGAIIGTGLIIAKKKNLKSEVPFGPFLVAGTLIALFLGSEIVNWYLNFILNPLF